MTMLFCTASSTAAEYEALPQAPYFAPFKPLKAPSPAGLQLKQGDRLAICGDSITEQKLYSRIMEAYLTVCVPDLKITVRQYGWSGEQAPGFLSRMTNDTLRFRPTIATTCYGMNDHRYQPYQEEIGREYRKNSLAIIKAFKANGVRMIQGSAGTVGKMPSWVKEARGTFNDLNMNLSELRNIGIELAQQEQVGFADVFLPMLVGGYDAQQKYGNNFMITGKDGVHPDLAGQLVMAYAFLKSFGLDGEIGTITLDLASGKATASSGHKVIAAQANEVQLESSRYPFCATGPVDKDSSLRAGMALVPFNQDLNRFIFKAAQGTAARYRVTWGSTSKSYSAQDLEKGINLAADFEVNPFSEDFKKVDEAVARKQSYETRQIKDLFHGPEGRTDADLTAKLTEEVREPLAQAIPAAFHPVKHTLQIVAE
jgi:lysophospholipase L1-like esterase